ncbi:MAG: hypothetical protein LC650_00935 [Actinobacteria bacterium]|nr:hypothetical protein [Actinomycetota bacterium]
MVADFADQTTESNDAGQTLRYWDFDSGFRDVRNLTKGILGGGIRVVGSTETWGEDYEEVEWAKMVIGSQTIAPSVIVTRRFRVRNIRDRASERQLWIGDDLEPIEFNIMGITPIMDPFGRPVEYELLLKGTTND